MKPIVLALAAAALVAAASPDPAAAGCRGCGVAAGVVGGLAAGAIIGSAIANSQPAPVYVAPPDYVDGPVCHVERHQYWDGYAYRTRRVEVCD